MVAKSSIASEMNKLIFAFVVCIVILAPSAVARTMVVAESPDPMAAADDFSSFRCITVVPEAMKCMLDVFKHAIAPHPSCCEAISKLHDCSSNFFTDISSSDLVLIESVCASWSAPIS